MPGRDISALNIAEAPLPTVYVEAKNALAQCATVDECKDWSDKAEAMRSYARQAKDETLRKTAIRIQARANRRCGQLLKRFQTSPEGGRPKNGGGGSPVSQRQAAKSAGLSKDQEKKAVRVANVPEDEFERKVEADEPPTITELAKTGTANRDWTPPDGFEEATKLLGTVRRFSEFCKAHEPEKIAKGILDNESADVRRMVTTIDAWLGPACRELGRLGMAYYEDLTREIDEKLDAYIDADKVLNADWITSEICLDHKEGLAENEEAEFWEHGATRQVRNEVRRRINKMRGDRADRDPRQAHLPGFAHLQSHYMIERRGDEVGVPIFELTDAEVDAKAQLYRTMGASCYEHADELERFKDWRRQIPNGPDA